MILSAQEFQKFRLRWVPANCQFQTKISSERTVILIVSLNKKEKDNRASLVQLNFPITSKKTAQLTKIKCG